LDVFDRDDIRIHLSNDSVELRPQTGPLAVEAGLRPHRADVLARKTAGHDLSAREPRAIERADIIDLLDRRPVAPKNSATVRISLDEYDRLRADPSLQCEVEPADAGEQRDHARPNDHAATNAANSTHSVEVRNAEAQVGGRAATRAVVDPHTQRPPSMSHTPNCSAWPCSIWYFERGAASVAITISKRPAMVPSERVLAAAFMQGI
jgi:hypothetical protein